MLSGTEFLTEIDGIIEADPGSTKMEDELTSLSGWDSVAIISFIAMADEKLGIIVKIDSLNSCKIVADLAALCGIY